MSDQPRSATDVTGIHERGQAALARYLQTCPPYEAALAWITAGGGRDGLQLAVLAGPPKPFAPRRGSHMVSWRPGVVAVEAMTPALADAVRDALARGRPRDEVVDPEVDRQLRRHSYGGSTQLVAYAPTPGRRDGVRLEDRAFTGTPPSRLVAPDDLAPDRPPRAPAGFTDEALQRARRYIEERPHRLAAFLAQEQPACAALVLLQPRPRDAPLRYSARDLDPTDEDHVVFWAPGIQPRFRRLTPVDRWSVLAGLEGHAFWFIDLPRDLGEIPHEGYLAASSRLGWRACPFGPMSDPDPRAPIERRLAWQQTTAYHLYSVRQEFRRFVRWEPGDPGCPAD